MGLVIKNLIEEKHKQNYQISSSYIHKRENREEYIKRTTPIYNELDNLVVQANSAKEKGDIDTLLNTVDKGIEWGNSFQLLDKFIYSLFFFI